MASPRFKATASDVFSALRHTVIAGAATAVMDTMNSGQFGGKQLVFSAKIGALAGLARLVQRYFSEIR